MPVTVDGDLLNTIRTASSGFSLVAVDAATTEEGAACLLFALRAIEAIRSPNEPDESIVSHAHGGAVSTGRAMYIDLDDVSGEPGLAERILDAAVDAITAAGLSCHLATTDERIVVDPRPPSLELPLEVPFPDDADDVERSGSSTHASARCLTARTWVEIDGLCIERLTAAGWVAGELSEHHVDKPRVAFVFAARAFTMGDSTLGISLEHARLVGLTIEQLPVRDQAAFSRRSGRAVFRIRFDTRPRHAPSPDEGRS